MRVSLLLLPDSNTAWTIAVAITVAVVGGLATWWHRGKLTRDRAEAGWDAILGVPEVKDRGGGISQVGQPGLVHRVTEVEHAVKTLTELVASQTALEKRVDEHDLRLSDHDTSIAAIIATTFERGATAALTAAEKAQAQKNGGK